MYVQEVSMFEKLLRLLWGFFVTIYSFIITGKSQMFEYVPVSRMSKRWRSNSTTFTITACSFHQRKTSFEYQVGLSHRVFLFLLDQLAWAFKIQCTIKIIKLSYHKLIRFLTRLHIHLCWTCHVVISTKI